MKPEDLIVWIIILMGAILLVTCSINADTPFSKRAKFNYICDKYQQSAIQKGYLDETMVNAFTAELQARGITITVMNVPRTKLEWGTEFNFDVQGVYRQSELQSNFSKVKKDYCMVYGLKAKAMCEE